MKIDGNFEVLSVTEAAGLLLDHLNRRVQRFADGVGDPVLKEGHDVLQILAEHSCDRLDGFQPRTDGPSLPALEVFPSPSRRLVSPKIHQAFLNRPGPGCPQSLLPQPAKLLSAPLRQVFPRIKPQILCPGQKIPAFFPRLPMLFFPDTIDRLHHMPHQMIPVKNNLLFALRHMLLDRGQLRVQYICRDRLDLRPLPGLQQGKIAVQALLPSVVIDMLYGRCFQFVDQGQIVMPLAHRLLIHSHFFDRPPQFALPSSCHRPAHDLPGLVPTDPQHFPWPLNDGLIQLQNGQTLKKCRKSRVFSAQLTFTCLTP